MKIAPGTTARLVYLLTQVTDNKIVEQVNEDKPAIFQFGNGLLLPAFEEGLSGLQAGEQFEFILKAEDAYGEHDPYAIFDIPIDTFAVEGKVDEKMLQVGNTIPMTDNNGNKHFGKITKLMEEAVTMNFNHPLAGIDLRFAGRVLEVTPTD